MFVSIKDLLQLAAQPHNFSHVPPIKERYFVSLFFLCICIVAFLCICEGVCV